MCKIILGVVMALTLVSVPLTSVVADEAQPQLPPHLQALGVTQATDTELAEVRGEGWIRKQIQKYINSKFSGNLFGPSEEPPGEYKYLPWFLQPTAAQ